MSWTIVGLVVGLPTLLLWCALRLASRASRVDERKPLHKHVCSVCGRVQRWTEEFDQWSPCRGCQLADSRAPIELDLDDFRDAGEIRRYLADVAHRFGDATSTHTAD